MSSHLASGVRGAYMAEERNEPLENNAAVFVPLGQVGSNHDTVFATPICSLSHLFAQMFAS